MDRLDQITTFVRVVERGGFAAAARDLQLAPSVVTTQIQALEQRLGVRLLNRNTRSVKPTEVGEAYYERCLDLLRRFDLADDVVQSMQSAPRGVLRLNVSMSLIDLVTPIISEYAGRYPDVSVRMIMTGRDVDLIDEQFDLAVRHRIPNNGSLIVRKLAEYSMVVCASPSYFAQRAKPEKPSDLVNHNCLIYTDSGAADRWPIFSTDSEMTLRGNFRTNSTSALLNAAENGQGIVVLPQFAAARSLAAGRLTAVLQQYTTVTKPIAVIYPHRGLAPMKTTVFVDMLTKHIPRALTAVSHVPPVTPRPPRPSSQVGGEIAASARSIVVSGRIENASHGGIDPRSHVANGHTSPRARRVGAQLIGR
jgi:DNA-binding transcriptional LysR family regulator